MKDGRTSRANWNGASVESFGFGLGNMEESSRGFIHNVYLRRELTALTARRMAEPSRRREKGDSALRRRYPAILLLPVAHIAYKANILFNFQVKLSRNPTYEF
jgi:hypothetical protein